MSIPIIKMALIGILPSRLKVAYYRRKGARIGSGVKIGLFSVILANDIEIGSDTKIGPLSFVRCRKLALGNRVRLGSMVAIDTNDVKIGHDSVVMEQVVIGGMKTPRSRIEIGARVKIFPYSFLNPTEPIIIENEVGIGGANYLFTHGSWQSVLEGFPIGFGPITIRKGVWLPWRVFILPNVEIGEYSTIGAGAVINKSIPAQSLAVGAPAKVISSDGAYLKRKTRDEKIEIVRNILKEMAEFLEFEMKVVKTVENDGILSISITDQASKTERVDFVPVLQNTNAIHNATALVSFEKIPDDVRLRLTMARITWFDIESGICAFGSSAYFDEIRNFFSRYGVRYAVFGENDI